MLFVSIKEKDRETLNPKRLKKTSDVLVQYGSIIFYGGQIKSTWQAIFLSTSGIKILLIEHQFPTAIDIKQISETS